MLTWGMECRKRTIILGGSIVGCSAIIPVHVKTMPLTAHSSEKDCTKRADARKRATHCRAGNHLCKEIFPGWYRVRRHKLSRGGINEVHKTHVIVISMETLYNDRIETDQ